MKVGRGVDSVCGVGVGVRVGGGGEGGIVRLIKRVNLIGYVCSAEGM